MLETPPIYTAEELLEEFVREEHGKRPLTPFNRWLEEDPTLRIYVRRAYRFFDGQLVSVLDLASIEANPQGKGRFTKFLEFVEDLLLPFAGVYVENVQTARFAEFFRRRGYKQAVVQSWERGSPSFYKLWDRTEERVSTTEAPRVQLELVGEEG